MLIGNGQPVKKPQNYIVFEQCCDCGLTHLVLYHATKRGVITKTSYRDDHLTEEDRKKHGIVVYQRKK